MQSIAAEQQHFCTAEPGGRSRTLLRSGDDTDECTRGRLRCSRVIRVSLRRRRNACVKSAARAFARTSGASAKVRSAEASLRTRYSSASHTHARTTQGATSRGPPQCPAANFSLCRPRAPPSPPALLTSPPCLSHRACRGGGKLMAATRRQLNRTDRGEETRSTKEDSKQTKPGAELSCMEPGGRQAARPG